MKLAVAILTATVLGWAGGSVAAEQVVVTTLDWPPYTGEDLPEKGATTAVVRRAFAAAGMDAKVEVVPWKRAISMAQNDPKVAAYFPGYHCHHDTGFVSSDPVGNGPLGFAENVDAPIHWSDLADLEKQGLTIGTVLGYANTEPFDNAVNQGEIRAVPANDDATNLRKLALKRIDAAVIDKLVMSYLLSTDPSLKADAGLLRFHEKPLEDKTLYVCFNDDPAGHALRDRFNAGLKTIDASKIIDEYFNTAF